VSIDDVIDELVKSLLEGGFSVSDAIRDFLEKLISRLLLAEAKSQIDKNNETLPDGRDRLTLNGSYLRKVLTSSGPVKVKMPRILDRKDGTEKVTFNSNVLPPYLRRTPDVTDLVPWLYLMGISSTQISDVATAIFGESAKGFSPATVLKDVSKWVAEFKEWSKRDMSGQRYPYIWCDGVYFRVRGEKDNQAVLVLLGVSEDGKKELLAIDSGFSESADVWRAIFEDLRRRGMENPLLTIGDGGLGLWAGLRKVYPDSGAQQCWVHAKKSVLKHLPTPKHSHAELALKDIYNAGDRKAALDAAKSFECKFGVKYPKAVNSIMSNLDRLLTFYDYPAQHWIHIRTTNVIESVFSTVRLRTDKTRGKLGEETLLALVFKLVEVAAGHFRCINGVEQLQKLCEGVQFVDGLEKSDEK
jgi:transposase-like protein